MKIKNIDIFIDSIPSEWFHLHVRHVLCAEAAPPGASRSQQHHKMPAREVSMTTTQPASGDASARTLTPEAVIAAKPEVRYAIVVAETSATISCPSGLTILEAAERTLRPRQWDGAPTISVGCRRGGCGVCKIRIVAGRYRVRAMSRAHVTETEENDGYVLACCTYPETDLHIQAAPVCPKRLK
jgi:ferredoxin